MSDVPDVSPQVSIMIEFTVADADAGADQAIWFWRRLSLKPVMTDKVRSHSDKNHRIAVYRNFAANLFQFPVVVYVSLSLPARRMEAAVVARSL
ncbi:hypothetical protein PT974_04275 [Cladobotryum mycophilum]|uniref:Uncharacterized protein n=1 Tax=Cladobotryum mycophilum TaxID=491253 RepID=A0ABR0SUQ9_9HYPO